MQGIDEDSLVEATQASQNAQSGYAADYGSKRPLLALHEIAEWMRGQRQLASDLPEATPAYLGLASCASFHVSDAYTDVEQYALE